MIDLAAHVGRTIRVGGLILELRADGLLLDDGTASGPVILRGAALELLALLEPEDAINATGRVERLGEGLAVVVDDPGGIVQAGDPVAPVPPAIERRDGVRSPVAVDGAAHLESALPTARSAGLLDGPPGIGGGLAGLVALVALSLASLAVTLGRRLHDRRRLEHRIAARLAAFGAPTEPPTGMSPVSRSAERDGSTFGSA
jgi:hypothetical protein